MNMKRYLIYVVTFFVLGLLFDFIVENFTNYEFDGMTTMVYKLIFSIIAIIVFMIIRVIVISKR